jgi:hypothetical protein
MHSAAFDESFWPAPQAQRHIEVLVSALEARAQSGQPMHNFQLQDAELANLNLLMPIR